MDVDKIVDDVLLKVKEEIESDQTDKFRKKIKSLYQQLFCVQRAAKEIFKSIINEKKSFKKKYQTIDLETLNEQ